MDLNDLAKNPEQIKSLIAILQSILPDEKANSDDQKSSTKKKSTSKLKTKTRQSVNEDFENKFLLMPEKDMHKSDSKIDKKLNVHPPTPRTRSFKPVDVICRVCGKHESVSPQVVPDSVDRYRCNKCSSSASN